MSTNATSVDLVAAETFLREQARILDVRRFERAFGDGTDASVLVALRSYDNADGGYAGLLEPDLRTTRSQPQSAELALRVLDEVGVVPADRAAALCDWLQTVSGPDGGVPFTHPSARVHPAALHWHHADGETPSLNPTAALVGLLHRHGIRHPWLDDATAFCRRALGLDGDAGGEELDLYSVRAACWLLDPAVPLGDDRDAVREVLAAGIREHVALDPALTAPGAPGHHIGPLEVAPFPDSPGRELLPPDAVEAALEAVVERQLPDGGWQVNFPPISTAATAEWRSWATLQWLLVLRAAGRV